MNTYQLSHRFFRHYLNSQKEVFYTAIIRLWEIKCVLTFKYEYFQYYRYTIYHIIVKQSSNAYIGIIGNNGTI